MLKNKNRLITFFIVLVMVLSGFIAMAGAAEEQTEEEQNRASAIVGKVLNAENEPIAGAIVLLRIAEDNKENEMEPMKQRTNERGMFEFENLRPNIYILVVEKEGYQRWSEKVEVPQGKTVEQKIILKNAEEQKNFGIILGWVYNALEEEPIPGAHVVIGNERSDREPVKTETDREGHFKVRVPAGRYIIMVEARGFEPYKEELVVENNDEINLRIGLKPIKKDEPKPHKKPSLSGQIFDAVTDEPIYGWVELSKGNPKPKCPQPPKDKKEGDDPNPIDRDDRDDQDDRDERPPKTRAEEGRENPKEQERKNHEEEEERKEREEEQKDREEKERNEKERERKPKKPEDDIFWRTYSNRKGYYEFLNVQPGHYEMRVFAKGHRMYYNEINIGEKPLYIDVYLLREKKPAKSVIMGGVVDSNTKEPITGAVVCIIPAKILRERLDDLDLDLQELGLDNLDLENLEFSEELEVSYSDLEEKEVYAEVDKEIKDPELDKSDIPLDKDKLKTRCCKEPERECPKEPEQRRERKTHRFCTRTDENGFFKLSIPPGQYVLIVKARGYKVFTHKFEIKPCQLMKVRVPMRTDSAEELAGAPESSDTSSLTGSVAGTAAGAPSSSAILSAIMGILILIVMGLSAIVWRKHRSSKKITKN